MAFVKCTKCGTKINNVTSGVRRKHNRNRQKSASTAKVICLLTQKYVRNAGKNREAGV